MTQSAINAAKIIQQKAPGFKPKFAMTLGSGLGDLVDLLKEVVKIPYTDLPDFPPCTVVGHAGNLYLGKLNGVPVAFLQGRAHLYEGVSNLVAKTYVRTMKLIGSEFFFITNAAGSMREETVPGDLVLINDYINFQFQNILSGHNDDDFGPRFLGMEDAYDLNLRTQLLTTAEELKIPLKQGVYFAVLGPQFETPAEIRCYKNMGGDVVAMSAINELVTAHHCGMKVVMVSAVTNMAAGMSDTKISHELTLSGAVKCAERMKKLVLGFVEKL
ncbi:MAG: purine-nucleoside phosphorylase [Gammaproteobacteria bacterium]|nr:purine-nucleoside phosphorylase [Gammaproteobacteria bacterium]